MEEIKVTIETETIRLCDLLKFAGVTMSGGESKALILEGLCLLNGDVCLQKGKQCTKGDLILCQTEPPVTILVDKEG